MREEMTKEEKERLAFYHSMGLTFQIVKMYRPDEEE